MKEGEAKQDGLVNVSKTGERTKQQEKKKKGIDIVCRGGGGLPAEYM